MDHTHSSDVNPTSRSHGIPRDGNIPSANVTASLRHMENTHLTTPVVKQIGNHTTSLTGVSHYHPTTPTPTSTVAPSSRPSSTSSTTSAEVFDEELRTCIRSATALPDSISAVTRLIIGHPDHAARAVVIWHRALLSAPTGDKQKFLFIVHDVLMRISLSNSHRNDPSTNTPNSTRNSTHANSSHPNSMNDDIEQPSISPSTANRILTAFAPTLASALSHIAMLGAGDEIEIARRYVAKNVE